MGGSRRRLKRNAPKVRVGVTKRKADKKTVVPKEITQQNVDLQKKLNMDADWVEEDTLYENYQRNSLVADPNQLIGRKEKRTPLVPPEARKELGEETFSDDDEMRAACNQARKSGKAPPPRLTTTQREIITKLVEKHGEDNLHAMVLDTKLNKMQHSEGALRKLIESLRFWAGDGRSTRHDFRTERKPPKKLLNCRIQG